MFQPTFSFPGKTGAEVAAIYNGLVSKNLTKLAAALLTNYAVYAPSDAHFGEFFAHIEEAA